MGDAIMEGGGLTNVYNDLAGGGAAPVGFEDLLAKNPDVVIVTTTVDPVAVEAAFLALPGAQALKAVQNREYLVMKYDYTDPPTPLSVAGLEKVAQAFATP